MKIQIFDGAMGTMLQQRGLEAGACPELMNLERSEAVSEVHRAYVNAGATIVETNTFGASPLKLAHYGLADSCAKLNRAAVEIAKNAVRGRAKVAGSMGPTGRFIAPLGDLDFEEAYESFRVQAAALAEGGADYLIIETCIDLQEMRAAILAARDVCPLPIIGQFSYGEDGRTVTGTDPETAATMLTALGVSIIGVNCSLGPKELVPIVQKLAESTRCPISVQPNAGMPYLEDGETRYPMSAEEFGRWGRKLVEAGASYVGGCCGTTPEHIAALARETADLNAPSRSRQAGRGAPLKLCSRTKTVTVAPNLPTKLIGERINPTGRKKLAEDIRGGSFMSVKKEALNQVKAGADLLDVNMGVGGIDQAAAMARAIGEIAQLTDAPLVIDTGDTASLERGLRLYPGRALVNSVSAETKRLREFLPLAKKYGAAILCLPITDEGVPKTVDERLAATRQIIRAAREVGLTDGDFLLDALVMTVSADAKAAGDVLDTLKRYREEFYCPTTMGLSNISFGLPNRPLINSTFFALCLAVGLDAPIMNPYDESMQNTLAAARALLGEDPGGIGYSQKYSAASKIAVAAPKNSELSPVAAVKQAVIDGAKDEIAALVENALAAGASGAEITDKALTAAMNDIGADFGAGRMFLPQVMLSAETMKLGFDRLKTTAAAAPDSTLGTVIMATVKGDVHDLGKNIAGALLESGGFKIVDLGKDVPREKIVAAAREYGADIVGLCALMTTTMTEIEPVIAALKEDGSPAKVMVGGAVLTQEYADSVGADAYAADGVKAVELAKKLVGKE